MGLQQQAIDAFLSAVELNREWGDTLDLAYAWVNLATTYLDFEQNAQARELLERAAPVFAAYGETRSLVDTWINLSATDLPVERKVYYLDRAIRQAEELKYTSALAYAWHNRGSILLDSLHELRSAIPAFAKAVHYSREAADAYEEATATIDLGHAYLQIDMLDSAEWHLRRGLELARQLANAQMQADALEELAELFARKGDFAQAYALQQQRIDLLSAVFDEQLSEKLAEANARYEAGKREARIAEQQLQLEKERNLRYLAMAIGLAVLLLVATILQRRYYRQRREMELAELEVRRKTEEAELWRKIDEQKTAFFSYLAHELRTPLTLLLGPLEEALSVVRQSNLTKPLHTAHRQANQLLMLVNQILDMVRHDAGQLEKQERPVELTAFFTRLYDSFIAMARKKRIELAWEVTPELRGTFLVDTVKLRHILYNLLSNALKFTPAGGRVAMKAWLEDGQLRVAVRDTGPGIDLEEQARIFERYYQTDAGRQGGGTGLGLAWAAELARFLGGTLGVESTSGQGATFTLSLPVARATGAVPATPAEKEEVAEPAARGAAQWQSDYVPRVLLVEDNPDMGEFVRHLLDPPMVVQHVFDGKEALDWLGQHEPPDLIISDVMMPHVDGFELRRRLRQHPRWREIPFVFLSASDGEKEVLEGLSLGVDDYLVKPFRPAELVARVQHLLERARRRRTIEPEPAGNGTCEAPLTADEELLRKAEEVVLSRLDDPDFKVADLAEALSYSKRQLSRVIGRLTGMTPVEFILEIRLQKAMELLRKGRYATVSEVRYEVGIESASYFTTKFRQRFGIRPSEVRQTV